MSKNKNIYIFICLALIVSCSSSPYKLQNVNAANERYQEVNQTLDKCVKFIQPYFDEKPKMLLVYVYGDRESFLNGLGKEVGFSKEEVEFHREHNSAPRPVNGKLLVPPNLEKICHEVVHYYLESNTNEKNLLNAKWFDEGFSSYLTFLFNGKTFNGSVTNWFKKEFNGTTIPVDKMETKEEWSILYNNPKLMPQSYVESMMLMNYFFQNYSVDQFKQILKEMKIDSFNVSFKNVTGITLNKFYEKWVNSLK